MLAVLYRHRALFIILALILLAVLAWLFIAARDGDKTPSRGVFVISRPITERLEAGGDIC